MSFALNSFILLDIYQNEKTKNGICQSIKFFINSDYNEARKKNDWICMDLEKTSWRKWVLMFIFK